MQREYNEPKIMLKIARRMGLSILALSLLWGANFKASAEEYPSRPIRVVIPIAAGSSGDILLRQVLPGMSKALGANMFVDNRTGAAGQIGTTEVTRAKPDGYTVLFAYSQVIAVNPSLYKTLPYDPIRGLTPIGGVASQPLVFTVSSELPVKSVADFVAYGKAHPRALTYASSGNGTSSHLAGAYISELTGIDAMHIPYNNFPQALVDVTRGEVNYLIYPYPGLSAFLQEGRVRALAVTGTTRSASLPELPTMLELGYPDFVIGPWYAFYAPSGTPKAIVDKLNNALNHALQDTSLHKLLTQSDTKPWATTPEELQKFTLSEIARYRDLVRISGAKVE